MAIDHEINIPVRVGWRSFRALMPGFLIANLEGSIVNVALPTLQQELTLTVSQLGWISMATLLPTAALSPLAGNVADHVGRRRVYSGGLAVIVLGSLVAAIASGFSSLLVGRLLQGIGSAMIIANGLAIVAEQFDSSERSRALGYMTAVVGLGAIASPLIGGGIAEFVGWRGIFVLSAITAAPGLVWVRQRIPGDAPIRSDWFSRTPWLISFCLTLGVSSLILAIWGSNRWGWNSYQERGFILAAVVGLTATLFLNRRSSLPLLELNSLSSRTGWSLVVLLLGSMVVAGLGFALPLHLFASQGLEGFALGMVVLPFPLGLVAGALLGGRLGAAWGTSGTVIGGLIVFGVGITFYDSTGFLGPFALALAGIGVGAFSVGNNTEIVHGRTESLGSLTGLVGLLRLSGNVLGVAIAGVIIELLGAQNGVGWLAWIIIPSVFAAILAYRTPSPEIMIPK